MKSNYFRSIMLHVGLLLLILMFPFVSNSHLQDPQLDHVIIVDFSRKENVTTQAAAEGSTSEPAQEAKINTAPAPATPKEDPLKTSSPKSRDVKSAAVVKKDPIDESTVRAQDAKPLKKDQTQPSPTTKEEIEAAKRAKALAAKKSHLSELLAQSKQVDPTGESDQGAKVDGGSSNIKALGDHSKGNIRGAIGNRKVLKIPTIKDDSQKKGRVVVQICVDASGHVISSNYTMKGSTTSDTYLIKLAEKGAMGYEFSPSPNPKECGKVTIEFLLK